MPIVDEFVTLRRERVALVRKIDAAALHRSGVHGKVGELFVPDREGLARSSAESSGDRIQVLLART